MRVRLYKGQIVRTHLNEYFANLNGLKGSVEAKVLHLDYREYKARVHLTKAGTELWVPFRAVVADCKAKRFQQSLVALQEKFSK